MIDVKHKGKIVSRKHPKHIARDAQEDRRTRQQAFRDILKLQRWKKIPIKTLVKRVNLSRRSYYNWRDGVDTPRRSSLRLLWSALHLTAEEKADLTKEFQLSEWIVQLMQLEEEIEMMIPKDYRKRIGEGIVELRKQHGMTQNALAQRSSLSKGLIYKIETGRQCGDFTKYEDYLKQIAQVFNMTVEDMVEGVTF